jgi:hypothetical protein
MDINTAKKNLEKLNAHPDGIFTVSKKEKLVHISSWNLTGRFVKWIHNRDGTITTKVQKVIQESKAACEAGKSAMPLIMTTQLKTTKASSKPANLGPQNSELIALLEYLLRNEIITPQEYDQKLKDKDFSTLPNLRELKKNDLATKKLKRPDYKAAEDKILAQALQKYKIDTKIPSNPESFLIHHIDTYLAPYFQGKITAENEDKTRPPLIQKLDQEFKAKFPDSRLSKDELEACALAAYIEASSRHFQQLMAASEGELKPNEVMVPALKSSINIDFKGIKTPPEEVEAKIHEAAAKMNNALIAILTQKKVNQFIQKKNINALIKEAATKPNQDKEPLMDLLLKDFIGSKKAQGVLQEAALEHYLEISKESIKEKILKENRNKASKNIDPDKVHGEVDSALAKHLPELKKGLEKNFPGASQEGVDALAASDALDALDARAKRAMKEIAPYIIYKVRQIIQRQLG